MTASPRLSVLVVARNEEERLPSCLERLTFADELVVVLDRCTDRSRDIAQSFGAKIVEGAWEIEGIRRNVGLEACTGDWILEVDADEHFPPELAAEIRQVIASSPYDYHAIPLDNYIGDRRVRYGWGCHIGTSKVSRLHRRGAKRLGQQQVHPSVTLSGRQGPDLTNRFDHYVDRDISDLWRRLDSYARARARDLRSKGDDGGGLSKNVRRIFTRFLKCYLYHRGYREGGYGILISLCGGLYPFLAYMKARYERD